MPSLPLSRQILSLLPVFQEINSDIVPMPDALSSLTLRNYDFHWGSRTYLMGILNVTPDSFSDGGQYFSPDVAISKAQALVAAGADIVDIGGQSTRPQAETVTVETELERVIPVIAALRRGSSSLPVPISVDTTQAVVAEAAIAAGADLVNDISGATFDPAMLATVAKWHVPIVLMHIRGTPQTMQQLTDYGDVVAEVCQCLHERAEAALAAGLLRSHIILDPGIGFAKTVEQNLTLLRSLRQFRALGYPLLVGASRKSFIGHLLNQPDPRQRVWGTAATCAVAIAGGADILRVHDLPQLRDVCQVADAIYRVQS